MDESLPQMFVFLGLSNKHSQYSKDKTQVESQLGKTLDLKLWIFTPPPGLRVKCDGFEWEWVLLEKSTYQILNFYSKAN